MGTVVARMGRSTALRVDLTSATSAFQVNVDDVINVPKSARELLERQAMLTTTPSHSNATRRNGTRLIEALDSYPLGDEARANMWEFSDPLASWIVSPPEERPNRWLRLRDRLPEGGWICCPLTTSHWSISRSPWLERAMDRAFGAPPNSSRFSNGFSRCSSLAQQLKKHHQTVRSSPHASSARLSFAKRHQATFHGRPRYGLPIPCWKESWNP